MEHLFNCICYVAERRKHVKYDTYDQAHHQGQDDEHSKAHVGSRGDGVGGRKGPVIAALFRHAALFRQLSDTENGE